MANSTCKFVVVTPARITLMTARPTFSKTTKLLVLNDTEVSSSRMVRTALEMESVAEPAGVATGVLKASSTDSFPSTRVSSSTVTVMVRLFVPGPKVRIPLVAR